MSWLWRRVSATSKILCLAKQFGATECVNPLELKTTCEEAIVAMTDGGCDYTFECIGNVKTMVGYFFCDSLDD